MVCRSERFRLASELKNEEREEGAESSDVKMVDESGSGESEWTEISKLSDCEPIRTARTARGSEANPKRRATSGDWSTYECCVWVGKKN